ncbi:MAG: pyruvate synthase [Syntrophomonadaceae bacterium]|nr:pyruvate synthase [Syntrophomonadaceae bacterium]
MPSSNMVEIRWHGRGGQGAKMACLLLADVAALEGKFVQGFPEYGPERMGAPITAYNRISEKRCTVHSNIYHPDYVVVVDESLLDSVHVTGGLREGGAIIINTPLSPREIVPRLRGWQGRVCTIDARRISEEILGRNFPNTPMLAAAVRVSGVLEPNRFLASIEESFKNKFAAKPQLIEGNMATLQRSMEEVQLG